MKILKMFNLALHFLNIRCGETLISIRKCQLNIVCLNIMNDSSDFLVCLMIIFLVEVDRYDQCVFYHRVTTGSSQGSSS